MQDLTKLPSASGPFRNPFRDDVYSQETALPGTPQIHENATRRCINSIDAMISGSKSSHETLKRGEIVLVSSPLAGYGKSHLIGRVSKSVLNSVTPLPLSFGPNPLWEDLLTRVIDYQSGSTSSVNFAASCFDETASRFLSLLVRSGISQDAFKEKDCPVSVDTLENDFCSAFVDDESSRLISWLKGKITILSEFSLPTDSQLDEFSQKDVLFWGRYFTNYFFKGRRSLEIPMGTSQAENRDRLIQLLRISSSCRPLLITADPIDSCHESPTAGMEIATIVTTIAERVPRSLVILSLNQDLWESVFEQKLPSAYLDRLNRDALYLESISADDARQLVINRLHSDQVTYHQSFLFATALSGEFQWDAAETLSPRSVIRQADEFWSKNRNDFFEGEQTILFPESEAESKTSPIVDSPNLEYDPFGGHSPNYSDRPVPQESPIPDAIESNRFDPSILDSFSENYSSGVLPPPIHGLPGGQLAGSPWPHNGSPQQDPVPQHNDEPPVRPPEHPPPPNGSKGFAPSIPDDTKSPGRYLLQLERKYSQADYKLHLDLAALEQFVKQVGNQNASLVQDEIEINESDNKCLRWELCDFSTWVGFEPIENIDYYRRLLQNVLSDPREPIGKIVCFSSGSGVFDRMPYLASGLTDEVMRRYFDIVHFSDTKVAMIHAAIQFLREATGSGYESEGARIVLIRLAPLWNRMCHPIDRKS